MAGHRQSEREHEQQIDRRLASLLAAAPRHARQPGSMHRPASRGFPSVAVDDTHDVADGADGLQDGADDGEEGADAVEVGVAGGAGGGDEAVDGAVDDVDPEVWTRLGPRRRPRSAPDRGPGVDLADLGGPEPRDSAGRRLVQGVSVRFGRPQTTVIAAIVLIGLLLAGWAVLRARPVAIASPAAAGSEAAPTPGPPTATTAASPAETAAAPAGSGTPSPVANTSAAVIEVHVLGAVRHPGVVELPVGGRVDDAVRRAGGLKASAHLGALNLAQPLADGQQVFIARGGGTSEVRNPTAPVVAPPAATSPGSGVTGGVSASTAPPQGLVDLNTATLEQLDQLPGIGPVTAQKILDWRQQNGRFSSIEELQEVDGIGPKTFADLQPLVTV